MKIKIDSWMKVVGLALATIMILIGGVGLLNTYREPEIIMEEQEVFNYQLTPKINYEVRLVDNNLYEKSSLAEDEYYLSNLVSSIGATFGLEWKGSKGSTLKGEYSIVAEVRGYTEKGEQKEAIWSKEYELLPLTRFESTGDTWQTEHQVEVNYNGYRQFAQAVKEKIQVTLPTEVAVKLVGHLETEVEGEVLEVPLDTQLMIPLEGNYFEISKQGVEPLSDQVMKQVEQMVPLDKTKRLSYSILVGIGIGGILFILLGTAPLGEKERVNKQIQKILREHGSRMVGVQEIDEEKYSTYYQVKQIEDLVKIADEIEQPILYMYHTNKLKINKFYVIDKEVMYCYKLEGSILCKVDQEVRIEG